MIAVRRRWPRILALVLVALLALAVAGFIALWVAIGVIAPTKIKARIETSVSTLLGRTLTIDNVERAKFPKLQLRATGVKLTDKSGRVLARSDEVVAWASPVSALKLRLGVEEIRFEKPEINLWYEKDGRLNVEHIISEIAKRPKAAGPRSASAFFLHRFTVNNARLTLADVPGAPAVIDGRADGFLTVTVSPLGLRGMPFELTVNAGEGKARLRVAGRLGAAATVDLRAERFPARALAPRIRQIGNCAGKADGRLLWKGGASPSFDFSLSPAGLCDDAGPLPDRLSGIAKRKKSTWTIDLAAQGVETRISASGKIPRAPQPIMIAVTGDRADIPAVTAWGSAFASLARRAMPGEPAVSTGPARTLAMKVAIASATYKTVEATAVAFEVHRATTGVVRIDPVALNVFGGRAQGSAVIREGTVRLELRGLDWSLATVNAAVSSTASLTGRMDIAVTGEAPVGAPFLSSFTGRGEVWVQNFELERVPAILKAITSANFSKIERVLKGEKKDPFPPAKGNAQAALGGGVATVEKLVLENRVLRIGYTGRVGIVERNLDGTMVIQTLTAVDQILNDIPIVGDLLLGDGKSFLPLWFRLEGPWADPRVRPMPAKNIAAPVWNIFQRVLDLPQDAFDLIRGK